MHHTIPQADLLREVDFVNSSSSNSRTTQQQQEAAAAEQQQQQQQQQQHSTSRTPEAALGTAVEAGKHGGARRGKVKWRSRWSCFVLGAYPPH